MTAERKPGARVRGLIKVLPEQYVHPIERNGAAADDEARRNCAPENISAREAPDCQQGSEHRYENAGAGYPERQTSDFFWVQVAAFFLGRTTH